MCALAEDNLIPGTSFQLEAGSPNFAGRYDGRGVDYGSPAELSQATRLSRPARPVSDQRHFVALLYTLSRDTTEIFADQSFFETPKTRVILFLLVSVLGERQSCQIVLFGKPGKMRDRSNPRGTHSKALWDLKCEVFLVDACLRAQGRPLVRQDANSNSGCPALSGYPCTSRR